MKTILVRYGELTLKGANRNFFIKKLLQNIKFKVKPYREHIKFITDKNSLTLEVEEDYLKRTIECLKHIFGIHSISIVERVEKNLEKIKLAVLQVAKEIPQESSFKLEVSRKDKSYSIKSNELKLELAAVILKNNNLKVDVHKPQTIVQVVIKSDAAYIFSSKIKTLRGLPVGVSGKGLSLLSGGIDSPVASYLALKRGMQVDFLHFMTPPHTTPEALNKVFELAKKVAPYNLSNFSLYVCDFSKLLQELMHIPEESYRITIMRRMFIRIANILSDKIGAKAIITGESLGQVASQTIESINVINEVSNLTILRPLITYDKEEIIAISKDIDTYETSILPFDDVCSMFVPKKPVTKPKSYYANKQEESISMLWEGLIDLTINDEIKKFVIKDGEYIEIEKWDQK